MKRPGVLRYSPTSPTLHELAKTRSKVRNALTQAFEYMVDMGVGFGVLSTLEHTWLLRRLLDQPGQLQVGLLLLLNSARSVLDVMRASITICSKIEWQYAMMYWLVVLY